MSTGTLVKYETPDLPAVATCTEVANRLIVDDQTTYDIAIETARGFKVERAKWEEKRKEYKTPIDKLAALIQADFMPVINALDAAEVVAKGKALAYVREQEAVQRKAQAEADRVAREAAAAAEKAAQKLEKKGDVEAAAAVREIAAVTPVAVIAPLVTQSGGNSIRKTWKARLVDKALLVNSVNTRQDLDSLLAFDQSAANKYAAATNGKAVVPGLEFYDDSNLAIRK